MSSNLDAEKVRTIWIESVVDLLLQQEQQVVERGASGIQGQRECISVELIAVLVIAAGHADTIIIRPLVCGRRTHR